MEDVGSHAYRLNTPPGVHPVFHTCLLRPAANDSLPSQIASDPQPPPLLIPNDEGQLRERFTVEKILSEPTCRFGRSGFRNEVLVKYFGYAEPLWETPVALEDSPVLDEWDREHQPRLRLKWRGELLSPASTD